LNFGLNFNFQIFKLRKFIYKFALKFKPKFGHCETPYVENDVLQEGMHPDIVAKYVNCGFNMLQVGNVHPKLSHFQGWSSWAQDISKWDESMVFPISWHECPVIDVTSL
jgi:hypothetical protein